MLGAFHVQHCIGKYIKGSGLEDSLVETNVFGVKVLESVLNGSSYAMCSKGFQILGDVIEQTKWKAFWKIHKDGQVADVTDALNSFSKALISKDKYDSQEAFNQCISKIKPLTRKFQEFSVKCQENSAMCRYWDGFLTLRNLMRRLIAADRTGKWEAHLQTVQDLLPIFRECDSLN